jgi:HSP20 family protein
MLAPWDPIAEMTGLRREMDRLFSTLAGSQSSQGQGQGAALYLPVDVRETDQSYQVHAPLPGFKPDQVEVTATDGALMIRAHRQEQQSRRDGDYLRREVSLGNYVRQLALPRGVNPDAIKASFEDGMLTVEVPKVAQAEPKKIEVTAASGQQSQGGGAESSQ